MPNTLRMLSNRETAIDAQTAWYLSDLGEFRGKQDLYIQQSPQKLKTLREHALIESAVASNRIEGVVIDPSRVRDILVSPRPLFRDRDEEEIRGYRDALALIHQGSNNLLFSEESILKFHAMARGQIWDAGKYKEKDVDIIETYPDGEERVRFRPVSTSKTPEAMASLVAMWKKHLEERWVPPVLAMAACNLDFLCIHPFRDGNGRVSRLLWLLQSYQIGYEVGRYISLERLIETNKDRYYETLEISSQGWHEGKHNPWPFINFSLHIMKSAYRDFVSRVGDIKAQRGDKRDLVIAGIKSLVSKSTNGFTIGDLENLCPGVSRDMVRVVLREQQSEGFVESLGRGPGARWAGTNSGNGLPPNEGNKEGNICDKCKSTPCICGDQGASGRRP